MSAQKPDSTGSGVFLAEMVKSFVSEGHEVAVIAGITKEDRAELPPEVLFRPVYFEDDSVDGVPFPVVGMSDEMPYRSTRYRDMTAEMVGQFRRAFQHALEEVMSVFDPDVIICHHLYLLTAFVRELYPEKKIFAVSHSTDLRQMRKHSLEKDYILSMIPRLDRVLALHREQKHEIEDMFGIDADDIEVIGTGFNNELFNPCGREIEESHHRLIFVGKIWEKKGVISLIRSLDLLPYHSDELSLHLVGGHASEDEYNAIRELASHSRFTIEFLGKYPQDKLADEYRKSEVFVLPSFFEGLPLVAIEALACGCKVVVSDLPGIAPWLDSEVPDAPITYVTPPPFVNADEPDQSSLPAFEQRLAKAIESSITSTSTQPDLTHLCWKNLSIHVLSLV